MKYLYTLGSVGLLITLLLNLAVWFWFKRDRAAILSTPWWTQWFPIYAGWIVFVFAARHGH